MEKKWIVWKSKLSNPYIDELTVFIKVKIANLKEFSRLEPEIVNNDVKNNKEIINIIRDKKYLLTTSLLTLISK